VTVEENDKERKSERDLKWDKPHVGALEEEKLVGPNGGIRKKNRGAEKRVG